MRLLVIGCFAPWVAAVAAQAPKTPTDHPATQAPATGRSDASTLTEKLRPSTGAPSTATAIARKNLIDEHIFGKMEADRIPHAGLSSDEEFFRRVHIDLTGHIPADDELRKFLESTDADKRDTLVDRLPTTRASKTKWTYFLNDIYKPHSNRVGVQGKVAFQNAFRYIEPFAARQMIRSQEIGPLFA
jgi:Protein of unknown function (DUF1549)